MRSMTGATSTGSGTAISSGLHLGPSAVAPVACELVRLEVAGEALDHLTGERKLHLHLVPSTGLETSA